MLREGTILRGIYRIEKQLATGGFGNTYIAINTEFDERVAIKEFFIKGKTERDETTSSVSVSNVENMQEFEEQRDKFKKEARRIRKLNNKHIIRVYDLFEENGTAYYVMDYIDGESLADRLKHKNCPMSEQEVLQILPQILDALKTVHDINLWHLDLKPANIMIDKQGQVTLIDFGASKHIEKNGVLTTSSAMAKTEGYFPPEQTSQTMKNIGAWTDIYSLGATLYKLLTNSTPPTFDDIINDDIDAFKFPSTVSSTIKDLIIWMMKPNRKQRPQNIDEINAFLATHGKGEAHKQDTIEETIYDEETILEPSHQKEEVGYEDTILMDDIPPKEENVVVEVEPDYDNHNGVFNFILAFVIIIFVSIIVYMLFNRSSSTDTESNTEISTSSDESNYGTTRVYYSWGNGNYTGDLKDGEPNGHGTIIYDDGKKFVGEFKEGKAHGKGVYTSATGKVLFDGTYENGGRIKGTMTYDDGSTYTGGFYHGDYEWLWGTPHGQGVYRSASGEILFEGEYDEGERKTGYGKEVHEDYTYEGNYKNGKWNGQGTLTWPKAKEDDSYKFVGEFADGWRTNGRMYFVGGAMYDGSFKNNQFTGKGTIFDDDGTYQTGTFKNGELINITDEGTWSGNYKKDY